MLHGAGGSIAVYPQHQSIWDGLMELLSFTAFHYSFVFHILEQPSVLTCKLVGGVSVASTYL